MSESCFQIRDLRVVGIILGLLVTLGVAGPASAQEPVDQVQVESYVSALDTSFWEWAWARHLRAEANDDGTVDWDYDARRQLSTFTDRYQRLVAEANGFWTNLQVQDYLQRRLLAVHPNPMMPGRPGAFAVRVLRTSAPNALAFNDGTILLTTGLLATLKTEAELEALLAHEVAHITLDHALSQYQSGQKRTRARNLLGVLGKIAGGVASAVTPLDIGGGASLPESAAYGLEDGLADQYLDPRIIETAGLAYSRDQEAAASRLAQRWLLSAGRPPAAQFTALRKIRRAATHGSAPHRVSFLDSHPVPDDLRSVLSAAIENAGGTPSVLAPPSPSSDATYDTHMAAVLEHAAEIDIAARRYRSALAALERAIQAQWTAPKAYLLKAIAVRNTATGPADHDRALALLDTAAARTEAPEPRIDAERALVRLRQDRPEAARRLLARCVETIDAMRPDASSADSGPYAMLRSWATDMAVRLRPASPADRPVSGDEPRVEDSTDGDPPGGPR